MLASRWRAMRHGTILAGRCCQPVALKALAAEYRSGGEHGHDVQTIATGSASFAAGFTCRAFRPGAMGVLEA